MIDTVVISRLSDWSWIWFKVTGVQKSNTFCANYHTEFSIDLKRIWNSVDTCWCIEPHTHVISSVEYSMERTLPMWFRYKNNVYRPISFKLDMMIETTRLYILISVWMILTFIQGHSCMRHFLRNLIIYLDENQSVATTCWFAEAHDKCILQK